MIVPRERIATCRDCNAEFTETNRFFTQHEMCMPTKCKRCRGELRECKHCKKEFEMRKDGARVKYCSSVCAKASTETTYGRTPAEKAARRDARHQKIKDRLREVEQKAKCSKCGIRIGKGNRFTKCPKCRREDAADEVEKKRAARWERECQEEKSLGIHQMRGFTAEALFDVIAAANGFVPFAPSGINFPSIDRVVMDGSFMAKRVQIKGINSEIWNERGLLHSRRPINWNAVDWLAFVNVDELWVAVIDRQPSTYSEGYAIDQSLHIWTLHKPTQPPGGPFSGDEK